MWIVEVQEASIICPRTKTCKWNQSRRDSKAGALSDVLHWEALEPPLTVPQSVISVSYIFSCLIFLSEQTKELWNNTWIDKKAIQMNQAFLWGQIPHVLEQGWMHFLGLATQLSRLFAHLCIHSTWYRSQQTRSSCWTQESLAIIPTNKMEHFTATLSHNNRNKAVSNST